MPLVLNILPTLIISSKRKRVTYQNLKEQFTFEIYTFSFVFLYYRIEPVVTFANHKMQIKLEEQTMNNEKVWLITGAGRGMGVDITNAALKAGHKVVATGRNTENVAKAIGEADNLLIVKLDV